MLCKRNCYCFQGFVRHGLSTEKDSFGHQRSLQMPNTKQNGVRECTQNDMSRGYTSQGLNLDRPSLELNDSNVYPVVNVGEMSHFIEISFSLIHGLIGLI